MLGGGWGVRLPILAIGIAGWVWGFLWLGRAALQFGEALPSPSQRVRLAQALLLIPYIVINLLFTVLSFWHPLGAEGVFITVFQYKRHRDAACTVFRIDSYGDRLREAWFLDFEMVGSAEIAYVTRHSGFAWITTYRPDGESLAWAAATARRCPELGVTGRPMVIGEEVGALRSRGFRGLCLVGYGPDGWLENWHQYSDRLANLNPAGLEKAARFAWEMILDLDQKPA